MGQGDMLAELDGFLWRLGIALAVGAAFFVLRIALARSLRNRIAPGLVPRGDELHQPDTMSRFTALLGHDAAEATTLGARRLPATLGLRLLYWVVLLAMIAVSATMRAPLIGLESALTVVVLFLALHTTFYEITWDRETITLPRWWFGSTKHKWRDLEAVTERQGWFLAFHFRGGKVVQAHKYVVGYAGLRDKANATLREV
jgi:hypothetical protein